jgi:alanine racemase
MAPEPSETSVCARVDLGAFRKNLHAVQSYVHPDVRVMAVVKADAYGHGMARLAGVAAKAGVSDFGVARVHEAVELRRTQPDALILSFEVPHPDTIESALKQRVDLTAVTQSGVEAIESVASRMGLRARVHVKVDTGMGRLGLPPSRAIQVIEYVARSRWLELAGVYSHFATSEEPDQTFAHEQLSRFVDVLEAAGRQGIGIPLRHMASSGAIMTFPGSHFDMVRPGILLYGYPPAHGMAERYPVAPVLSLVSRVAFIKEVEPGTSISYGRHYRTTSTTKIATVPIGYADGYPRLLRGKALVLIHGRRYPVAGTICMDHLMVDIGPDSDICEGDEVVMVGESGQERVTAWDIAAAIGTIPYEITCSVSPRVPREYQETV